MKMFCPPTDKPAKGTKGCRMEAFGSFGTFRQWQYRYFSNQSKTSRGNSAATVGASIVLARIRHPLKPISPFQLNHGGNQVKGELVTTPL
jgi:hypothetical protein